jgi:hypothetical protein
MGWMAWDLMRGVDLLLGKPGIDRDRIILLGAVAGGGDPAAVTAALDKRIAAVVPFNFGGPQPETVYPLPEDAEKTFNYMGGGSWESTRNLRLSGRDGFLPWVIVGSVAPRGLIHAHEFSWDQKRDPVWKRLEKIWDWYEARDRLAAAAGKGTLRGNKPEDTHCNNIGAVHRREIHPTLKKWFGIPISEEGKTERFPSEKLICWTRDVADTHPMRPVHELAAERGAARAAAARQRLAKLSTKDQAEALGQDWTRLLGKVERPKGCEATAPRVTAVGDVTVERVVFAFPENDEPGIAVPAVLLMPRRQKQTPLPVVVGVAQEGKAGFLRHRSEAIVALLRGGVAVCLPDLRGTGEMHPPGDSRGRTSAGTSLSSSHWMLGRTLLGGRLRDLRLVLVALRGRSDLDSSRIALWGESFAPVNTQDQNLAVPLDAPALPKQAEPLGGLLALFGALYEKDIRAAYARGGLSGYQSLLQSQFLYVPHDAIVPGALTAGDLCDVATAQAPRPLRLEGLVDGLNRRVAQKELDRTYAPTRAAYQAAGAAQRFVLRSEPASQEEVARWLIEQLKGK